MVVESHAKIGEVERHKVGVSTSVCVHSFIEKARQNLDNSVLDKVGEKTLP